MWHTFVYRNHLNFKSHNHLKQINLTIFYCINKIQHISLPVGNPFLVSTLDISLIVITKLFLLKKKKKTDYNLILRNVFKVANNYMVVY